MSDEENQIPQQCPRTTNWEGHDQSPMRMLYRREDMVLRLRPSPTGDGEVYVLQSKDGHVVYDGRELISSFDREVRETLELWAEPDPSLGLSPAEPVSAIEATTPPEMGEMILGWLCNRDMREAVLGDLAEQFEERVDRNGLASARRWYWLQVTRSAGAFMIRWIRRALELEALWNRVSS